MLLLTKESGIDEDVYTWTHTGSLVSLHAYASGNCLAIEFHILILPVAFLRLTVSAALHHITSFEVTIHHGTCGPVIRLTSLP